MAIRIRIVDGTTVALCAVEVDPMPGDLYLDDGAHYALAAKFARDWRGRTVDWSYPDYDALADTQKLRDAEEELHKWLSEQHGEQREIAQQANQSAGASVISIGNPPRRQGDRLVTHTKPRSCTATEPCGCEDCGYCLLNYYDRMRFNGIFDELVEKIDLALAKRAEWMREQAAKQLEVLHLPARPIDAHDIRRGSNIAVKNGAALIRALPLAPGGDDDE